MAKIWEPRISIQVTEEQFYALQALIPWGLRRKLFSVLIDMLIKALTINQKGVIGAILTRELDIPALLGKGED